MKKIKNILLYLNFFYIFFILILCIITYANSQSKIKNISKSESIQLKERIDKINSKIVKMEEGECKNFLNEYSKNININLDKTELTIQELYNEITNFPNVYLYGNAKDKCNITDEDIEKYGIDTSYLALQSANNLAMGKYTRQYMFLFNNKLEKNGDTYLSEQGLNLLRKTKIDILSYYIDSVNDKVKEVYYEE